MFLHCLKIEVPFVRILLGVISGLYYEHMIIVNDDCRVVNELEASLTDDARIVIYNCHMFIAQATGIDLLEIS